jgi:hypothetical protein
MSPLTVFKRASPVRGCSSSTLMSPLTVSALSCCVGEPFDGDVAVCGVEAYLLGCCVTQVEVTALGVYLDTRASEMFQIEVAANGGGFNAAVDMMQTHIAVGGVEAERTFQFLDANVAPAGLHDEVGLARELQRDVDRLLDARFQFRRMDADAGFGLLDEQAPLAQLLLEGFGVGSPQAGFGLDPSPFETAGDVHIACRELDLDGLSRLDGEAHGLFGADLMFVPARDAPALSFQLFEGAAHLFESALGLGADGVYNCAPVDAAHGFLGGTADALEEAMGFLLGARLCTCCFACGSALGGGERVDQFRGFVGLDTPLFHQAQNAQNLFSHRFPPLA